MSLTNPNKVVTEARLSEFYQGILPYLGGMPEILANKFSKGDMYSTDEKMIGQWTDGKPLYQRTFSGTTASSVNTDALIATVTGCDKMIQVFGWIERSNGRIDYAPSEGSTIHYDSSNNGLYFYTAGTGLVSRPIYITSRYTKTTDSAVSIGNETDYSTTEKIVGTWIDGKPIYQKTFSCTIPNGVNVEQDVEIDVSSLNVEYGIKLEGLHIANDVINVGFSGYLNPTPNSVLMLWFNKSSNKVILRRKADTSTILGGGSTAYITFWYTKTTD